MSPRSVAGALIGAALAAPLAVGACGSTRAFTATIAPDSAAASVTAVPGAVTSATPSPTLGEIVLPTSRCGNFFIATALLNGRGPFRLLLDTGFPRTQLSHRVARALDVRRSVDSIDVGELRLRGRIPIAARDLDMIAHALGTRIDGILGYAVFRDLLLTYDFPAGMVRVSTGGLSADAPGTVGLSTGERPFMRARLGTRTIAMLLDTGFNGGIALTGFDRLAFEEPARAVGARVRADGVGLRRAGRLEDDLVFDAFTARRPIVTDAVRRPLVGQDILRHFVVTLDRTRGLARIATPDGDVGTEIDLPPVRATGLVLVPRSGHFDVAEVLPGTPARAAGLRAGDRIVAIDGVPIARRGCPRASPGEATTASTLSIERDGARFDVEVAPRVLVR